MNRKSFLEMIPHLISSMVNNGEKKIAFILSAIEFSIKKSDKGTEFYLEQLGTFSEELLKDFPIAKEWEKNFKEAQELMGNILEVLKNRKSNEEEKSDPFSVEKVIDDAKNFVKNYEVGESRREPKIPPILNMVFDMASPPQDPKKFC
jgi:hypothetical protein